MSEAWAAVSWRGVMDTGRGRRIWKKIKDSREGASQISSSLCNGRWCGLALDGLERALAPDSWPISRHDRGFRLAGWLRHGERSSTSVFRSCNWFYAPGFFNNVDGRLPPLTAWISFRYRLPKLSTDSTPSIQFQLDLYLGHASPNPVFQISSLPCLLARKGPDSEGGADAPSLGQGAAGAL